MKLTGLSSPGTRCGRLVIVRRCALKGRQRLSDVARTMIRLSAVLRIPSVCILVSPVLWAPCGRSLPADCCRRTPRYRGVADWPIGQDSQLTGTKVQAGDLSLGSGAPA